MSTMANGELCRHCGFQETDHIYYDDTCNKFETEFDHHEDCPELGCDGICEETIRKKRWAAICEGHSKRYAWTLVGPRLVLIDMGS